MHIRNWLLNDFRLVKIIGKNKWVANLADYILLIFPMLLVETLLADHLAMTLSIVLAISLLLKLKNHSKKSAKYSFYRDDLDKDNLWNAQMMFK
jgi:hypothetical protein